MPNRKEPQLNLNPSSTSNYEVRSENPAPYNTNTSSSFTSYEDEEETNNNFNLLGWLSLVVSLTALALGIWLVLEVNQQPKKINQLVGRLEEIELALANTGKNLNQTGNSVSSQFNEVKKQLELHFSEIDKLWGVRKQTRLALEDLDKTTANLTNQQKRQQTALTATSNQLKKLETNANSQLGELNLVTSALREDLTQLKQVNQQLAKLKERLVNLEQAASTQEIAAFKKQLTEHQEILRSLETSRSQLVQRLTKLDAELQALQK